MRQATPARTASPQQQRPGHAPRHSTQQSAAAAATSPTTPWDDALRAQLQAAGSGASVDVDQIVHEILLDPAWTLRRADDAVANEAGSEAATAPLPWRVQRTMRDAYWDQATANFAVGGIERSAAALHNHLATLRAALAGMLPAGSASARQFDDAVDLDLIAQQLRRGILDVGQTLAGLLTIAAALCAPVRDAVVQALQRELQELRSAYDLRAAPMVAPAAEALVPLLRRVHALFDTLRLDMLQFHLESARPLLLAHGIAYERRRLRAELDAGQVSLHRTEAWLAAAVARVRERGAQSAAAQSTGGSSAPAFAEVIIDAILHLLASPTPWTPTTVPETWRRDLAHLHRLQILLEQTTVLAALLLLVRTGFANLSANRQVCQIRNALDRLAKQC